MNPWTAISIITAVTVASMFLAFLTLGDDEGGDE